MAESLKLESALARLRTPTRDGAPVYNVSLPLLVAANPEQPLRILDVPVTNIPS